MGPTGPEHRVLQIHPTRRCNLRCLHCYSVSGPEQSEALEPALLASALRDASTEGYNVAGFSGGEPLLYRPLAAVLSTAKECGMTTTVTSNGMLMTKRRLQPLKQLVDLLAISLDGVPDSHNRMRGSERAFLAMESHLDNLRMSGIPFGFIFTLTQHNVHELAWVAEFAVQQGAALLQIHPLEIVGRAEVSLPESEPDAIEESYAYLEAKRIQAKVGDRLFVQLDLTRGDVLREHPELVFADSPTSVSSDKPLAEVVSPLVVEASGVVVPIEYGLGSRYALGNLHEAGLRELAYRWRRESYPEFRRLCQAAFDEATAAAPLPFVNWYAILNRLSTQAV